MIVALFLLFVVSFTYGVELLGPRHAVRVMSAVFPLIVVGAGYGVWFLDREPGTKLVRSHAVLHWGAAIVGSYLLYVFL
jgi:hypothetical protein